MRSKVVKDFSSSVSLSTVLINPLKALLAGNLRLLIFTALLIAPTVAFFFLLDKGLVEVVIRLLPQSQMANAAKVALSGFVWSIALPILLVAIVLPLRLLWLKKSFTIGALVEEVIPALQRAYLPSMLSMVGVFLLSAALIFAVNIFAGFLSLGSAEESRLIILGVGGLFFLVAFRVFANLLVLPFLTTASGLSLRDALASIPQVLRRKHVLLLILLVSFLAVASGINFIFHQQLWHFSDITLNETICYAALGWYVVGAITSFCLSSAESSNSNQLRYLRELASPIVVQHHDVRTKSSSKKSHKRVRIPSSSPATGSMRANRKTTSISPQEMQLLLSN